MFRIFKFVGDHEGHGPHGMTAFGYDFSQGPVTVEAQAVIAKLEGNSHFEEVEPNPAPVPDGDEGGNGGGDPEEEARDTLMAELSKLDKDNDDHWTKKDGKPDCNHLKAACDFDVTRGMVEAVAPNLTRESLNAKGEPDGDEG